MKHIEDAVYRDHEIIIMHDGKNWVVDARSDNFDGPMLAGYMGESLFETLMLALGSVDKHEIDKALMVNIPF